MNNYYKIENPIDNDETLKDIIKAYLCGDKNESFYMNAVTYGQKDEKFNEEELY